MSERNVRLKNKNRETYPDGAAVGGKCLEGLGVFYELAFGTYLEKLYAPLYGGGGVVGKVVIRGVYEEGWKAWAVVLVKLATSAQRPAKACQGFNNDFTLF